MDLISSSKNYNAHKIKKDGSPKYESNYASSRIKSSTNIQVTQIPRQSSAKKLISHHSTEPS